MAREPKVRNGEATAGIRLMGSSALIQKLRELPNKVFQRGLVVASRRAMRPVVAQAKANAAVASGDLKRSIGVKVKTYKRSGTVVTIVGARGGFGTSGGYRGRQNEPAFYSHLVEGGHRVVAPYSLQSGLKKRGSGLTKLKGTGTTLGHVQGLPFLRPALESNRSTVVANLRAELGNFIEQEARKAAYA